MEENLENLNNKIYLNNSSNLLLGIINDLNQLMNSTNDNLVIKRLSDIINKINFIIEDNKKNYEIIRNDILSFYNELNKKFEELKVYNLKTKKGKNYKTGKYIGEMANNLAEGKGIFYWKNGDVYEGEWKNGQKDGKGIYYFNNNPWKGDRYEGEWKNDKQEGKGIYYYNNGSRYEGDFKNNKKEGKGIFYWEDGEIYEGDWKNDEREGKGIKYYTNGDRKMGDYSNGEPTGKHILLTYNGEVKIKNY